MSTRRLNDAGWAAPLLAAASLVASSTAALALALPATPLSAWFGLAQSSEAIADARARTAETSALDRAASRSATLRTLSQSPANGVAWLRLAYLDSLSAGGLGAEGNRALARSYDVAPFGPDETVWRLRFAFNNWRALDRSNRLLAIDEYAFFAARRPAVVDQVRQGVTDPEGWLALSLSGADMRS